MDPVRLDRVPPQNVDAERAVLGALMLAGDEVDVVADVISKLKPEMLYRESHVRIYQAIRANFDNNIPNDLLTVTEALEDKGETEKIGGVAYLMELIDSVPTASNALYYVDMVIEEYQRRRIIYASAQSYNDAFDKTMEIETVMSQAENNIMSIRENENQRGMETVHDVMNDAFKHIQDIYNRPDTLLGVPSGFKELDQMTSGFNEADFIIVAGRPGMGKSTLIQNIAQYVAMEKREPVVVFSLESANMLFSLRMLSCISGIDFQHIRMGQIGETMWQKITVAAGQISDSPMFLDDTPSITPRVMRSKLYQLKRKVDFKLIVVDYLQLMVADTKYRNREQEVSEVSRQLKTLAKEFKVPIIACTQLSRKCEERSDKRPQLADLRESGGIEQDADLVIVLYREKYYDINSLNNNVEIIVVKQRNGPTGTVELGYSGPHFKFYDLQERVFK